MDEETFEKMMGATYRALCGRGYADRTVQRIADESPLSKATYHYHFDTKEGPLNDFLDRLLAGSERRLASESDDPGERPDTFSTPSSRRPKTTPPVALMEPEAQAPSHDDLPRPFVPADAVFGVRGIWVAFFVSNVAGPAIAWPWFSRGTWRGGDVRGTLGPGPVDLNDGEPAVSDD